MCMSDLQWISCFIYFYFELQVVFTVVLKDINTLGSIYLFIRSIAEEEKRILYCHKIAVGIHLKNALWRKTFCKKIIFLFLNNAKA